MKIKCLMCGKIVEGDKKGHMIECRCENHVWIDETPYYARVGAQNLHMIEDVKDEEAK